MAINITGTVRVAKVNRNYKYQTPPKLKASPLEEAQAKVVSAFRPTVVKGFGGNGPAVTGSSH